jgi:hypothetical protein
MLFSESFAQPKPAAANKIIFFPKYNPSALTDHLNYVPYFLFCVSRSLWSFYSIGANEQERYPLHQR